MVLHYAHACGGRGRRRRLPDRLRVARPHARALGAGVYPAVTALADARRRREGHARGGNTIVSYAADWTEYGGASSLTTARARYAFRSTRCGPRRRSTSSASTIYAPLADWRDGANTSIAALASSTTTAPISRAQYRGGREPTTGTTPTPPTAPRRPARRSPTAPRQALDLPRQGSLELVGEMRITSAPAASSSPRRPPGAAGQADLAHRARLSGGRQGRQPAEYLSRSEIVGRRRAAIFPMDGVTT